MAKRPVIRLGLLAIAVLIGLSLYFWLAPRTPVVSHPVGADANP